MRVFQCLSCYTGYYSFIANQYPDAEQNIFSERLKFLLWHGFNSPHILLPAYSGDPNFAVVFGNDSALQKAWAIENSVRMRSLDEILLAQIEAHRTEVLYGLNPLLWGNDFLKRLPGCVKATVCWHASPAGRAKFSGYDLRVCNFPNFLQRWEEQGLRAAYFAPSHDPGMAEFAKNGERPIDITFAGNYSGGHTERNRLLEQLACLKDKFNIVFALLHPRKKPFVNLPFIRRIPGLIDFLPKSLRSISQGPVFGRDLYSLFSNSKIVLNASIDIAGEYRGNIRCYEAVGCGAMMLGQEGVYPEEFGAGRPVETYSSGEEAIEKVETLLREPAGVIAAGQEANRYLAQRASKETQWKAFIDLVERL